MAVGLPVKANYATGEVLTAANMNDLGGTVNLIGQVSVNTQTGTTYTLALSDATKMVTLSNAAGITLTVPTNATAAFPTGTQILLAQLGAGQVTIAGASGVTVNSNGSKLKLNGQYAVASIIKTGTDTWLAVGNLTT